MVVRVALGTTRNAYYGLRHNERDLWEQEKKKKYLRTSWDEEKTYFSGDRGSGACFDASLIICSLFNIKFKQKHHRKKSSQELDDRQSLQDKLFLGRLEQVLEVGLR